MRFKSLLAPISIAYEKAMSLRNNFYDRGILNSYKSAVPIISIGNLTMGGTGKTPLLAELIRWSEGQGFKPGIVSRGYKGKFTGVARVNSSIKNAAQIFGDEPTMLSDWFPSVPIYVGSDRISAVDKLVSENNVQIIFADDAFQHRRLQRDIDIVVVDCTEDSSNYRVMPLGRARESASALSRAHYIILNKVNLITPEKKNKIIEFIEEASPDSTLKIIECEYYINSLKDRFGQQIFLDKKSIGPVLLVSGVGNPQALHASLSGSCDIRKHLTFPDHHHYSQKDIDYIIKSGQDLGVNKIIVTEKDEVKLKSFSELDPYIGIAVLSPKLSLRIKNLYEKILHLVV